MRTAEYLCHLGGVLAPRDYPLAEALIAGESLAGAGRKLGLSRCALRKKQARIAAALAAERGGRMPDRK